MRPPPARNDERNNELRATGARIDSLYAAVWYEAETVTFTGYIALACVSATEAVPMEACDLAACHTDANCRPVR